MRTALWYIPFIDNGKAQSQIKRNILGRRGFKVGGLSISIRPFEPFADNIPSPALALKIRVNTDKMKIPERNIARSVGIKGLADGVSPPEA